MVTRGHFITIKIFPEGQPRRGRGVEQRHEWGQLPSPPLALPMTFELILMRRATAVIVLVYFHSFCNNSLLKWASQTKIARKITKTFCLRD